LTHAKTLRNTRSSILAPFRAFYSRAALKKRGGPMSEFLVVDAIRDGGGIDSARHEAICLAEAVGVARQLASHQERAERDAGTTFLTEVDIVRGGRLVSWRLDGPLPHCGGCDGRR
jgi:hypothetical protein